MSLTMSANSNEHLLDANRWKDLIITSLSNLKIFKFKFTYNDDEEKIKNL